jgi:hypothetical protein
MACVDPGTRQIHVAAYEDGAWVDMGHPEDDASLGSDDAPLVGESLWGGAGLEGRLGIGVARHQEPVRGHSTIGSRPATGTRAR